ncbi:hypothetical protein HYN48_07785 [Flavobacterium magnum]|uniref:IPT/TIG domain-containing protein n=1 Tax=Flavobacterium magnum TaxID=2162713 RepID=A0A2S0RE03_9FLAO|nr:IPT/TIG domain-containing protein [Flavobacterium magnum]AWA29983.1 hypothetical protein HYN48_07785 [Flavobacterium magnum]
MKHLRLVSVALLLLLAVSSFSCSPDDRDGSGPLVTNYPLSGLLGQEFTMQLENIEPNKLQVFFGNEQAPITYLSDAEIKITVPRTLTNPTSVLKIIDLTTNETIVNENFSLKTPVINGFSVSEVAFGEVFSINGDNFDTIKDDVGVTVNGIAASAVAASYNKIDVVLPTNITDANLQIKVKAQRQEVTAAAMLHLRAPQILSIDNTIAWIKGELTLNMLNYNPDYEMGEASINGNPCYVSVYNNQVKLSIPPGVYTDFRITAVTYKTAGQTATYNTDIPIGNDAIMVDYDSVSGNNSQIFERNGKAYRIARMNSASQETGEYSLMEFSAATEKWTVLSSFHYFGNISDALFDGDDTLYLYKFQSASQTYTLTKLNLNTYAETAIALPDNTIISPIMFAYQGALYLLSGIELVNGLPTVRTEKYKYSGGTWTTLSASAFSGIPAMGQYDSGKCDYMHFGNNIYVTWHARTYKITPALSVTEYPYKSVFHYQNAVVGRYSNSNSQTLYNIETNQPAYVQDDFFDEAGSCFNAGSEIYFQRNAWTGYHVNTTYTQRLRKTILNALL